MQAKRFGILAMTDAKSSMCDLFPSMTWTDSYAALQEQIVTFDKVASTRESVGKTTMILRMSLVNDNNCNFSRSVTPADIAHLVNNMDH